MTRRLCINLNPSDHDTLTQLYLQRRIATDRYMQRRNDLLELTAAFNGLTGREDRPEEILHYIQTKRRTKGGWVTFNGTHLRLPVVVGRLLDQDHIPILIGLFVEFNIGVEKFLHDHDLGLALERRFEEETGIRKRAYVLATALLELRKDGLLPKTQPREDGFEDFDAAEDAG